MDNKTDFFEKNIKKIVQKDLKLQEQDIEINAVKTGIESIPFLIDTYYQIVVIDEYFQSLKTFWDTTNVEILAQKIKNQFEIENIQEYKFYFFEKHENKIIVIVRNSTSTKIIKYKFDLE